MFLILFKFSLSVFIVWGLCFCILRNLCLPIFYYFFEKFCNFIFRLIVHFQVIFVFKMFFFKMMSRFPSTIY